MRKSSLCYCGIMADPEGTSKRVGKPDSFIEQKAEKRRKPKLDSYLISLLFFSIYNSNDF